MKKILANDKNDKYTKHIRIHISFKKFSIDKTCRCKTARFAVTVKNEKINRI